MDFTNKRHLLSPRLVEVIELLAQGLAPKQIARQLNISLYTVRNHVLTIKLKLNAETTANAIFIHYNQVREGLYAANAPTMS